MVQQSEIIQHHQVFVLYLVSTLHIALESSVNTKEEQMPTFLSVGSAWFFEIQQAALLIYVGFRCAHYRHSSIRLWRVESENFQE